MHVRRALYLATAIASLGAAACTNPLAKPYEYEEQVYLSVNGAATVIVDASVPALVALRGLPFDISPSARTAQSDVLRLFEHSGCNVTRVGQPWSRSGRRFVQVRIETDDVRTLGKCSLLSWSHYTFERDEAGLHFEQKVGDAAGGNPGNVNWKGDELIAFKLHAPSRILYHNVRRLADGAPGTQDRGNILTWEQRFSDRRASKPVALDVRMEKQAILYRTLLLFGGSVAAALATVAVAVALTIRKGRARRRAASTR